MSCIHFLFDPNKRLMTSFLLFYCYIYNFHRVLNACFQIYSQTLFAIVERWYAEKFPESEFVKDTKTLKVSLLPEFRLNPLRLSFRTAYVILTMSVAMLFPYFNEVIAFAGSIIFWPLTIYFPVEMYFVQKKVVPWSGQWIALRIYTIFCLLVTIFTLAGSIQGLIAKRFV